MTDDGAPGNRARRPIFDQEALAAMAATRHRYRHVEALRWRDRVVLVDPLEHDGRIHFPGDTLIVARSMRAPGAPDRDVLSLDFRDEQDRLIRGVPASVLVDTRFDHKPPPDDEDPF